MIDKCDLDSQGVCLYGPDNVLSHVLDVEYPTPIKDYLGEYLRGLLQHLCNAHSQDHRLIIAMWTLHRAIFEPGKAQEYLDKLTDTDDVGIRLKTVAKYGTVDELPLNSKHAGQGDKDEALVGAIAASKLEMFEHLETLGANLHDADDLVSAAMEAGNVFIMRYLAKRGIKFLEHSVLEAPENGWTSDIFDFLVEQGADPAKLIDLAQKSS